MRLEASLFYPISNRHLHICVGGSTVPRKLALGVVGQAADAQVQRQSSSELPENSCSRAVTRPPPPRNLGHKQGRPWSPDHDTTAPTHTRPFLGGYKGLRAEAQVDVASCDPIIFPGSSAFYSPQGGTAVLSDSVGDHQHPPHVMHSCELGSTVLLPACPRVLGMAKHTDLSI